MIKLSIFSNDFCLVITDYEVTEITSDDEAEPGQDEPADDAEFSLPGVRKVRAEPAEVSPVTLTTMTPRNLFTPTGRKW